MAIKAKNRTEICIKIIRVKFTQKPPDIFRKCLCLAFEHIKKKHENRKNEVIKIRIRMCLLIAGWLTG